MFPPSDSYTTATTQFAPERKVGEGGFGAVYVADAIPSLAPQVCNGHGPPTHGPPPL